jgi:DNA-dependent RNA polymerase auxiliary subunit epsilon
MIKIKQDPVMLEFVEMLNGDHLRAEKNKFK